MLQSKVVLVSFARTPIARFQGSFASKKATELGSIAIKGALARTGLEDDITITEAFMGNVVSAGIGQAPCRQAGMYLLLCTLIFVGSSSYSFPLIFLICLESCSNRCWSTTIYSLYNNQ